MRRATTGRRTDSPVAHQGSTFFSAETVGAKPRQRPRPKRTERVLGPRQRTIDRADASFQLTREKLERHFAGQSIEVEQVDAVLCEDFKTVFFYTYFIGDNEAVLLSCDLPSPINPGTFDRLGFAEALLSSPSAGVH
jgi:hypothetical protein